MKKKSRAFFVAGIFITSTIIQTGNAQSWNRNGNADATTSSKLGTTNSIPLRLFTNDAERVRIDASGNVGIGTNNPVNLLTVKLNGSTPAASWLGGGSSPAFMAFGEETSTTLNLVTAANSTGARPVLNTRRSRGTLASPAVVNNNDFLASFVSSGYDGSAFQNPATIDFYVDGPPSAGNVPGRISFVTGTNASTRVERVKVGSTGNISFNDNQLTITQATGAVGIGTSAPTLAKMVVEGATGNTVALFRNSPTGRGVSFAGDDPGVYFNAYYNAGQKAMAPGYSGLLNFDHFSGNLWMGITSGAASAAGAGIAMPPAMLITKNGLVGIGTTSPIYSLDVAGRMRVRTGGGSAGTWYMNAANTSDAAFVGMLNDNHAGIFGNSGSGWGFAMNTSNGNVGIGTSSPVTRLHVSHNSTPSSPQLLLQETESDFSRINFSNTSTANYFTIAGLPATANDAARMNFYYSNVGDVMTIKGDGKVGIGTGNPAYRLSVNGTIQAKELRIETGWADYVFEKNYKLRPLSEVETFIIANKHLPDVTPGAEIEKRGLEVGKVSEQMIRKIEELTLYMIQQEKSINELRNQNDLLSAQVNSLNKKGGK